MHRFLRPILPVTAFTLVTALVACDKMPLLAPTGTVINLTVVSDAVALNSSVDVVAVLIENGTSSSAGPGAGTGTGTSSSAAAGTPVQNGTVVSFTTTIGTIEPAEARTSNGRVTVKLTTGNTSGTATITAFSGGAKATAQVKVGAVNVNSVAMTASPASLPSSGGSTTLTARALDVNGSGVPGIPVTFTTDKGTLAPTSATTNVSGVATTTLTTTATAKVKAVAGAKDSGEVTVSVASRSTVTLTSSASSASISTPLVFTASPGPGNTLTNVTVDFGDNASRALGTLSAAQTATHFYARTGIFNVTVTGTDPDGVSVTGSTQVAIVGLSGTLAFSGAATAPASLIFTVTLDAVGTPAIDHYSWNFGDPSGTLNAVDSTGKSQTHLFTVAGTYTVLVTVHPQYGSAFDIYLVVRVS